MVIGCAEGLAVTRVVGETDQVPPVNPGLWSRFGPNMEVQLVDLGVVRDNAWRMTATMELSSAEGESLLSQMIVDRPKDLPL